MKYPLKFIISLILIATLGATLAFIPELSDAKIALRTMNEGELNRILIYNETTKDTIAEFTGQCVELHSKSNNTLTVACNSTDGKFSKYTFLLNKNTLFQVTTTSETIHTLDNGFRAVLNR